MKVFRVIRKWWNIHVQQRKFLVIYNCHKLNITIDDLLGECDLPSQEAVIVRQKVEELILATGKEIQNGKKRKEMIKFVLLKFFYAFIYIFLILLFEYTCINIRSLNWLSHEDCLCTIGKIYASYTTEITCHWVKSLHAN